MSLVFRTPFTSLKLTPPSYTSAGSCALLGHSHSRVKTLSPLRLTASRGKKRKKEEEDDDEREEARYNRSKDLFIYFFCLIKGFLCVGLIPGRRVK